MELTHQSLGRLGTRLSDYKLELMAESAVSRFGIECDATVAEVAAQKLVEEAFTLSDDERNTVLKRAEQLSEQVSINRRTIDAGRTSDPGERNCVNVLKVTYSHNVSKQHDDLAEVTLHTQSRNDGEDAHVTHGDVYKLHQR